MSRIRKGAITAVAAGMLLVGAAPVHASTREASGPCQFLMPISPEDVTYCACYKVATIGHMLFPDWQWACAQP
jgi:hypothetical protein